MKSRIINILIALVFLTGAGILFYPMLSDRWNQYQQDKVIYGYSEAVDETAAAKLEQAKKAAEEYNKNLLRDEIIIDPFDQVKDKKVKGDYEAALNPDGNGVMGTIEIPKIDVNLPIFHGTSEEVLQKAIGHLEQTSLPIGGPGTHAVFSGHRGLPSAKLFTDLDQMKEGDVFYIHVLDETLAYQVDQITVVEPNNLEDLAIVAGEDHVTLVTCTPYSINTHRLLVRGTRIPYEEAEKTGQKSEAEEEGFDMRPYIAAGAVVAVLLLFVIIRRKKKKS